MQTVADHSVTRRGTFTMGEHVLEMQAGLSAGGSLLSHQSYFSASAITGAITVKNLVLADTVAD